MANLPAVERTIDLDAPDLLRRVEECTWGDGPLLTALAGALVSLRTQLARWPPPAHDALAALVASVKALELSLALALRQGTEWAATNPRQRERQLQRVALALVALMGAASTPTIDALGDKGLLAFVVQRTVRAGADRYVAEPAGDEQQARRREVIMMTAVMLCSFVGRPERACESAVQEPIETAFRRYRRDQFDPRPVGQVWDALRGLLAALGVTFKTTRAAIQAAADYRGNLAEPLDAAGTEEAT